MDSLSIKLPKELIEEIDKEAVIQERSRPQQIRVILKKHYDENGNQESN